MRFPKLTFEHTPANHKDVKLFRPYLKSQSAKITKMLKKAVRQGDANTVAWCEQRLNDLLPLTQAINGQQTKKPPEQEVKDALQPIINFVMTAGFLHHFYVDIVAQTQNESVCYISGALVGDTAYLNHVVTFKLATQNPVRAIADAADQAVALREMEDMGLPFLAHFHSHPGHGANSNHPSQHDVIYQKGLEALGCTSIIGAIFGRSLDGSCFVRFWPDWKDFHIEIQGKGVKRVSKDNYQIGPYAQRRIDKRTIIAPNHAVAV